MSKPTIFISHSNKDRSYLDSFVLANTNRKKFSFWFSERRNIGIGKDAEEEIKNAIRTSNGAVLLISQNFINSKYILDEELPRIILKSIEHQDYIVLPILLEKCDWKSIKLLENLQLFNTPTTPLGSLKGSQYTLTVNDVINFLENNVKKYLKKHKKSKPLPIEKLFAMNLLKKIFSVAAVFTILFALWFTNSGQVLDQSVELVTENVSSLTDEQKKELIQTLEDEDEAVLNNTILQKVYPIDCSSSKNFDESNNSTTCDNLYNNSSQSGWISHTCSDQWIEFSFSRNIYIEFIVLQNFENNDNFRYLSSIKDIDFSFGILSDTRIGKVIERDNISQWIDINIETSKIKIDVLSYYEGESDSCGIQNITFYGRT